MFAVGVMVGVSVSFLISAILISLVERGAWERGRGAWERGFECGEKASNIAGHIIARNNDLDEIMVEYGADMARYKRVTDE
jgi:hypothetical protein